jgi:hypothetical protein
MEKDEVGGACSMHDIRNAYKILARIGTGGSCKHGNEALSSTECREFLKKS